MSFVGSVVSPISTTQIAGLGCCFAVDGALVTCDHMLEAAWERGHDDLWVLGPGLEPTPVTAAFRHPTADIAVLCAPGAAGVEPFSVDARAPAAGRAATAHRYSADDVSVSLPTVVIGAVDFEWTSTAQSRGTAPEHVREPRRPPRDRRYAYPMVMLSRRTGRGFCGGPVQTSAGALAMTTFGTGRADGSFERGGALYLNAVMPWITAIVQQQEEGPA